MHLGISIIGILVLLIPIGFVFLLVRLFMSADRRHDDAPQRDANRPMLSLALSLVVLVAVGVMFVFFSVLSTDTVDIRYYGRMLQPQGVSSPSLVEDVLEPRIPLEVESPLPDGLPPEPDMLAVAVTDTAETSDTEHPAKSVVAAAKPQAASEWINRASGWTGDKSDRSRVYHEVVVSDPMTTIEDCERQLNQKLMVAVGRFAYINSDEGGGRDWADLRLSHRLAQNLRLTPGMIREEIVGDSFVEDHYSEKLDRTMKRVYLRLDFDHAVREDIKRRLHEFEAQKDARLATDNLIVVCLIALAVLAVLGTIYVLLQFDTVTKGYYTKRMLIGAAVIAVLLVIFVAISMPRSY